MGNCYSIIPICMGSCWGYRNDTYIETYAQNSTIHKPIENIIDDSDISSENSFDINYTALYDIELGTPIRYYYIHHSTKRYHTI